MLRKVLALIAASILLIGIGCSSGTNPITPDKGTENLEDFFNSFDLSNPVVAEYTYRDLEGNVLASGKLGRNDDGSIYVIESRGAQEDIDVTALGLVVAMVTYNNPQGTIGGTGPNAGLPYYYIGQTMDYDINILSFFNQNIGGTNGFGSGPAVVTAEMHYASWDIDGNIVVGGLLPGDPVFTWSGIIVPGYQVINDLFTIVPGTLPGLDVTTVKITAPVFFGIFDVIFFDGVAGIWDP